MHLDLSLAAKMLPWASVYVLLRAVGKLSGFRLVAMGEGLDSKVRTWAPLGLIPQEGIVIGLALAVQQNVRFAAFGDQLLAVVMAATVIHELVGSLLARFALQKAGEIGPL